jgi:hypothetical protein
VISTHCGRHMQCAVCSWQASVRVGASCVAGTCPFRFNSQIETRDKQSSASENGKTGLVCSTCSRAGRSATSRYPELGRMDSMHVVERSPRWAADERGPHMPASDLRIPRTVISRARPISP